MKRYLFFFFAAILFPGCMVGPRYSKPVVSPDVQYPDLVKTDSTQIPVWFHVFDDTALQRLIQTAIDSNRDLLAAAANIEQAYTLSGAVKANMYPKVSYQAEAGAGKAGADAQKVAGGVNSSLFNIFGVLNWELDIWGKLRHQTRSSIDAFLSSKSNRDALQVSLVAEVATNYFLLRDLDNKLLIAQQTFIGRKENTRLISEKYSHGYVSQLDLLQAQQQESIAAASIPAFRRQIIIIQNALRILTGRGPGNITRGSTNYDQQLSPEIPVGLPSQLLERRPDILAAEYNLQSQFEQIGLAQANRFPSLSLTAALGFASPQLSGFLNSGGFVASGFGNIAGPLINFGQNKKLVEVQRKRTEVLYYQYQQITLNAFAEVDNALASYKNLEEEYAQRKNIVEAAAKALTLSQALYDNGYISYLEVIVQQSNLFDAQLDESTALQEKLNSIVSLYKALGGGWHE